MPQSITTKPVWWQGVTASKSTALGRYTYCRGCIFKIFLSISTGMQVCWTSKTQAQGSKPEANLLRRCFISTPEAFLGRNKSIPPWWQQWQAYFPGLAKSPPGRRHSNAGLPDRSGLTGYHCEPKQWQALSPTSWQLLRWSQRIATDDYLLLSLQSNWLKLNVGIALDSLHSVYGRPAYCFWSGRLFKGRQQGWNWSKAIGIPH